MKPQIKNHFGFSMAVAGLAFLAAATFMIISNFIIPKRLVIHTLPAAGRPPHPLRR